MAKIGVCLSGCGVNDGAEIHESVITVLALDRAGANVIYTAPNVIQAKVVDHYSGNDMNEKRNVLIESARIARAAKNTTNTAKITIGNDQGTADQIEKLGSQHLKCTVDDFIMDEDKKIVSTPAYMLAGSISEAASGIEKLVQKILFWV